MYRRSVLLLIAALFVISGCSGAPDAVPAAALSPEPSVLPEPTASPDPSAEPEPSDTPEPSAEPERTILPDGFAYVDEVNANIRAELRYAGTDNFTGTVVDGYETAVYAVLTTEAAQALSEVQEALEPQGLGLLIYDAYRPTRASLFFVNWAQNGDDDTKDAYYPDLNKTELHALGYISRRSPHSRGSTVDLTLVDLETGDPLDMGGPYDFFGEVSRHGTTLITDGQRVSREILRRAMSDAGFASYSKEWWHYVLRDEPFPDEYFDFTI